MYTTVSFTEMTDEYFTICLFESVCFKGLLLRRKRALSNFFSTMWSKFKFSTNINGMQSSMLDNEDTENDHQEEVIKVIDSAILPTRAT